MNIEFKEQAVKLNFVPYTDNLNTALELVDEQTLKSFEIITDHINVSIPQNTLMINVGVNGPETVDQLVKAGVINKTPIGLYDVDGSKTYAFDLTAQANYERIRQYKKHHYNTILK